MNYVGREPAPAGVILVGDTNPIGAIAFFHAPPDVSWAHLNGQILIKADYPELWAYAQGFLTADQVANPGLYRDVSGTTFAVPKLDGLFIRSVGQFDANRVASALGVRQDDLFKAHTHSMVSGAPQDVFGSGPGGNNLGATNTGSTGGAETRPTNVALVPCVKALPTMLLPSGTISPAYTFATQAEMEAGAVANKAVAPGMQKFHPGMPKAWGTFMSANPPATNDLFNVASVTRSGVGQYLVTLTVPFANTNYCVIPVGYHTSGAGNVSVCPQNRAVGSFNIMATGASFITLADTGQPISFVCFGDQ